MKRFNEFNESFLYWILSRIAGAARRAARKTVSIEPQWSSLTIVVAYY